MANPPNNPSRWSLLDIPPALAQEVAVVSCDGCDRHQKLPDLVARVLAQRPHNASLLSLPPLALGLDDAARLRYETAQARIIVSGCQEKCPLKLLQSFKPVDELLVLDVQQEEQQQNAALRDAIDAHSQLPALSPQQPTTQLPAALAKRKSFLPTAAQTPAAASSSPSQASPTSSHRGFFSAKGTQSYGRFSPSPTPKRRLWPLLFVLLAFGGLAWHQGWIPADFWTQKTRPNAIVPATRRPATKKNAKLGSTEPRAAARKGAATEPDAREPAAREPGAREPATREPATREPGAREPGAREPAAREPAAREPAAREPAAREPARRPVVRRRAKPPLVRPGPLEQALMTRINDKWTGGVCSSIAQCPGSGTLCLSGVVQGFCTRLCDNRCPDQKGADFTLSYCVDIENIRPLYKQTPSVRYGLCLPRCDKKRFPKTGCRFGATCRKLELRKRPGKIRYVCVPVSAKRVQAQPSE